MTGTLPSIPLQQNIDENGLPQSGCRLFVYEANTSTPVITYKDLLMSPGMEHSWPIVADALGRIPMFFVPDGFYRARLEDRYGTPIYDEPQLPALSTGDGGGGGGDADRDPMGDRRLSLAAGGGRPRRLGQGQRPHHRQCGLRRKRESATPTAPACSRSCGITSRRFCAVYPLAGFNPGQLDFDANKQIETFDMRGFLPAGADNMGSGTVTGRFVHAPVIRGNIETPGSWLGANHQVMTVAQMPYHTHGVATTVSVSLHDPGHSHITDTIIPYGVGASSGPNSSFSGPSYTALSVNESTTGISVSSATGATTIDGTGGNANQNNVPYVALGTWFIRL